jgi:chromosome segregation ATPase
MKAKLEQLLSEAEMRLLVMEPEDEIAALKSDLEAEKARFKEAKRIITDLREQRDGLRETLELAEATINRLHRHAPGSATGTLDCIRAALARCEKGEK